MNDQSRPSLSSSILALALIGMVLGVCSAWRGRGR
jgi:hypothetical protein